MQGRLVIVESSEFTDQGVDWIIRAVADVVQERSICHLMLAGGGSPLPIYRVLRSSGLPWHSMILYFGDERCVPPDHPDSNYRSITEALVPASLPDGLIIHRMRGEDDPESAAVAYAALLPAKIDILLLGVGEDGHTASLFPGSPALSETGRLVMPVRGSKPPPQRLTITPPVIHAADKLLVMVAGRAKAQAVQRALQIGDVPAALAQRGDWLIDKLAAALLPSS